ncbi:MAG: LuxR C-terminal-related transcriptional regulator [Actinomycetota bacterium]
MPRLPILRSKTRPPAPGTDLVQRAHLVSTLADPRAAIWSLTAPAGFGKTTLTAAAASATGVPFAWMTADPADDSPARFWSHVAASLAEVGVATDLAVAALLDDDLDLCVDELIAAIEAQVDDHGARSCGLVLDDLHEVGAPRVIAGITRLVTNLPAGLTLGLCSRHDIDLGLARRRLRGDVVELVASDLAFTHAEGRDALGEEIDQGVLDRTTAEALVDDLDGWPAGIRLARLALRSIDTAPDATNLVDALRASSEIGRYLTAEVLGSLDSDTRSFLVDTSILTDLAPGICDAVTGRDDSLTVLRSLAADQLFTSLIDPASSTFRVHRILRDHLESERAAQAADRVRELHRRAMRWYRRSDDLDAVIRHAVGAEEFQVALGAFEDGLAHASNRGQIDDMWRWIHQIGSERILADPVLAAMPAWLSLNQQRYDEIDPWLDAIVLVDDLSDDHLRHFAVQAATIRANRDRHLGRLDDALVHAHDAAARTDHGASWTIVPTVSATLAQLMALTGDPEAVAVARRSISLAAEAAHEPPLVMAYAALGLQLDDPVAAVAAADSALSLVTTPDLERFHRPAIAWLARARGELAAGLVGDAEVSVAEALRIAESGDEPAVAALAWATRARIDHLLGREVERRSALRSGEAVLDRLTGADWIADELRRARNTTRFAPDDLHRVRGGAVELTERELAVVRLLPFGMSRRELAAQLFVSENTLKTHLTSIRRKLGARGRVDIVERARELGLLGAGHAEEGAAG